MGIALDIQKVNLEDASNQLYIFNMIILKNKNNSSEYKKRCKSDYMVKDIIYNLVGKKYIIKKLLSLNTTNDGGNKKTDIKIFI